MKSKRVFRWSFLVLTTFTMAFHVETLFAYYDKTENLDLTSKSSLNRLTHARELLGKAYLGSLAEQSAGMPTVTRFVYNTFQNRMDPSLNLATNDISATLLKEADRRGFDPLFVLAVIQTESQFNPLIVGSHGEIGLMQVRPTTAKWIAQKENIPWKGKASLKDPATNIKIGIAYMAFLRMHFAGRANRYVAAYNMGPANVRKLAALYVQPRDYPIRVMTNYHSIYTQLLKSDDKSNWGVARL